MKHRIDVSALKETILPHNFYLRELDLCRFDYRSGKWVIAGRCPFHDGAKPGSFKINHETGAFKCWSCGACGGDIIAFLQQRDNLSFLEAIQKLSSDWGCR